MNVEANGITEIISMSALHININNNAIGSSNSSVLSGNNIFARNNNLTDFKQIRISPDLVGLYLKTNQISSIPNFTFVSASSLFFLELDDNHLIDIQPLAFIGLKDVVRLSLNRNRLVYLPAGVFSHIEQLSFLRLSGNPLKYISNQQFSGVLARIGGYTGIDLSSIPLLNTSIEVLRDLKNIEYLSLHQSFSFKKYFIRNTSVQADTTDEFPRLVIFILSSLNLGNQCKELLMKNLEVLDLSNNSFTSIPRYCLPRNSKAYNLDLSDNEIKVISNDSFDKQQQFWMLDLSYNNIISFEFGSLQHQTYLTDLNLEGNQIITLDSGYLTFSLKSVRINFESNPWLCDCDLIKTFLTLPPNEKSMKCFQPAAYAGTSVAELAAADNFSCRPQLCSPPYQTLLSFVGDKVELPCPVRHSTSSNTYWSVTLQELQFSDRDTFPNGVSILPHNALLISNAAKNMTGFYTCWSENEAGQTKFTLKLIVKEKLRENIEDRTNYSTMLVQNWTDNLQCGKGRIKMCGSRQGTIHMNVGVGASRLLAGDNPHP
ncbi:leucine-rich repeat and immunoglobulin-like domain-containing nogo receptor-interacting protein 3 [Lytechinus variegatus]|uniref:leucine-rich repeat and immunoglobulin-like domain-containing nogo receptor-interacting protein 3 n=1 Tax=Lytechinus variegatus TaxID=7654 RepID=UPI001BB180E1|nr:leucine-rich repeat and immunoglobulin-like domain-containing nogo receptor-interacting protein 3 [Lytechinus variegatus]